MLDSGLSVTIIIACVALALGTLYSMGVLVVETLGKKRKFKGNGISGVGVLIVSILLVASFEYCLYNAPYILFNGFSWPMIEDWGPAYFINAMFCLAGVTPVFCLYFLMSYFFPRPNEKPFFMVIVLGMMSAIGNSLVIFIINAALNRAFNSESRSAAFESRLYLYFLLGIFLFTVSAMVARKRLITITSDVVYEKRMEIIDKIIHAPYYRYEAVEPEKTFAALNNDTEAVSGFVNALVNGLTGVITMVTCFIYLWTLTMYGTLFTLLILVVAAGVFLVASQKAEKMFEKNRDIQNLFYKNIYGLVYGFKELFISRRKRYDFRADIRKNCEDYRETRVKGEFSFVGASILGEIMYIAVIGVIVFAFPVIFYNLQENTFRNYVLVCLYMGGIVNSELFLIPGLVRVLVSWRRIKAYVQEISQIEAEPEELKAPAGPELAISFRDVAYTYKNASGEHFSVGPINCAFKSGEIVFISGGNGSGKSTLAKLLTGLYRPDEGEITVNGEKVSCETLGSCFTTVYSDFYLFEKLYGIPFMEKQQEIEEHLKVLRIEDKVQVKNGVFSTVKLSTGQRKRLALLVSYLEDRPAYLFDEWAADQDPEFRKLFYKVLLPELKARGKAVIAITHDDRYFQDGDKHIKMEMGRIVSEEDYREKEIS